MATNITLQPGESVTITAAGAIGQPEPPPIIEPPPITTPPPGTRPPIESSVPTENLGLLKFDGSQVNSTSMTGETVAYGQISIPNPLPAGWSGKQANVSIFEYASGTYAKRMWMSREPFDYSARYPAYSEGNGSANIYMEFAAETLFAVTVQPGETWYVTIANQHPNGEPSCPPGANGNFGLRMYPPSS